VIFLLRKIIDTKLANVYEKNVADSEQPTHILYTKVLDDKKLFYRVFFFFNF